MFIKKLFSSKNETRESVKALSLTEHKSDSWYVNFLIQNKDEESPMPSIILDYALGNEFKFVFDIETVLAPHLPDQINDFTYTHTKLLSENGYGEIKETDHRPSAKLLDHYFTKKELVEHLKKNQTNAKETEKKDELIKMLLKNKKYCNDLFNFGKKITIVLNQKKLREELNNHFKPIIKQIWVQCLAESRDKIEAEDKFIELIKDSVLGDDIYTELELYDAYYDKIKWLN
jgi:hypothetical protein